MTTRGDDGITAVLHYGWPEDGAAGLDLRDAVDLGTRSEGYAWLNVTALTATTLTVQVTTSARNMSASDYETAQEFVITSTGVTAAYLTGLGRYVGLAWDAGTGAIFETLFVRKG